MNWKLSYLSMFHQARILLKTDIHTFNEHDQVLTYLLTLYKKANTVLVLNIAFLSTLHFIT